MKKKLFITLLIGVIIGILLTNNVYKDYYSNREISESTTSVVDRANTIAMMIETGEDTQQYSVYTSTEWPDSDEYTFNSSLSKCEKGSTLEWDDTNNQVIMTGNSSDKCYLYFDVRTFTLAEYIMYKVYSIDGENNLYYFDHEGDYTNASYETLDYSYRYSGASSDVNNFLCFENDCTDTDNLYRIIGVFQNDDGVYEVKVMKYEYLSETLAIDSTSGWDFTSLAQYLNGTYLTSLGELADFIISYTWTIGYFSGSYAGTYYVGGLVSEDSVTEKIGLVNVGEFGYASDSSNWATSLYSYSVTSNINWMYAGNTEWALSYVYTSATHQISVNTINDGVSSVYGVGSISTSYYARPTFYLSTDVEYKSGTGTIDDPIILNVGN